MLSTKDQEQLRRVHALLGEAQTKLRYYQQAVEHIQKMDVPGGVPPEVATEIKRITDDLDHQIEKDFGGR